MWAMRISGVTREVEHEDESVGEKPFPLLEMQHPNFVDIRECYLNIQIQRQILSIH